MRLALPPLRGFDPAARRPLNLALLLSLPLLLQPLGDHWVRVVDVSLLYVMLALGLNVVVGFAGLLDLGYVAFYAVGAYLFALLASPHLSEQFAGIALWAPAGLHAPWWVVVPLAAAAAAGLGVLLGAPTLRLRGDYLAVVTLGFGEIIRLLIVNLGHPVNITDGAKGLARLDTLVMFGLDLGRPWQLGPVTLSSVTLHYYLFLLLVLATVGICHRLQHSRVGRAWAAIRDDEVAATAMGIDTHRMKLLAFGIGASFGGVAGVLFGSFQGFVSPEAFSLHESVMLVAMVVFGGMGHVPGVIVGAVLLAALPEALRYVVGPLQAMTDGRLDAGILRPLLIAVAMIVTMRLRPDGLWPARSPAVATAGRQHLHDGRCAEHRFTVHTEPALHEHQAGGGAHHMPSRLEELPRLHGGQELGVQLHRHAGLSPDGFPGQCTEGMVDQRGGQATVDHTGRVEVGLGGEQSVSPAGVFTASPQRADQADETGQRAFAPAAGNKAVV